MDIDEVTSELRGFIQERFGIPENDSDFNDEVNLFNYGYIDSFGAVELTSFIESQFSIRLTEADWASFPLDTIREISSFVTKRHKTEI